MSSWVVLVVLALATARITGLVVSDDITAHVRNRVAYRNGNLAQLRPVVGKLVTCQWCASIWVSFLIVVLPWFVFGWTWLWLPFVGLAFSQVTGMLSDLGRK